MQDCLLCRWDDADREFHRVEVWRDGLWRLTVSLRAPVLGFAYLEPQRHIPYITELDGAEASSIGPTLARVTRSLKDETGADLIYVNVHGDRIAHLHFNLAPHTAGDALLGGAGMIRASAEPLPEDRLRAAAARIGRRLR
jgi:diadenosine tetraphosphate (Ap4A) HIT family hydrolase